MEIKDPLEGDQTIGFLYVYRSDVLPQDAGSPLVQYNFNLVKTDESGSNDYKDAYMHDCSSYHTYECKEPEPMNPEDSLFSSAFYERHFVENW